TSILAIEPNGATQEYDGGYDDYLRQQPELVTVEPKPPVASDRPRNAVIPERRKKLGFKEKRELQAIPEQIEKLEQEVRKLHESMADPLFYKQERDVIAQSNEKLNNLEQELAAAYGRWEVLEAASE